jgi:amino acid transporter
VAVGRILKRIILGQAMASDKLHETLLPKRLALPIFASDALSSVAYAPDEIFLTLGLAGGTLALTHSWMIALAVIFVMVVVVASYRQNVHAYPSGGGDYEVATVNLGPRAGLTVASALLVDYVLTVAVSISSGIANASTSMGFIRGHEALYAVVLVVLLTAMNLRGVRESGKAFALPTYAFMVGVLGMGVIGAVRHYSGSLPMSDSAGFELAPSPGHGSLGTLAFAFLLLRAFSSGCAALTGGRGDLQWGPGLQTAEKQERRDHPPAHGGCRGHDALVDHQSGAVDECQARRGPRDPTPARRHAGR